MKYTVQVQEWRHPMKDRCAAMFIVAVTDATAPGQSRWAGRWTGKDGTKGRVSEKWHPNAQHRQEIQSALIGELNNQGFDLKASYRFVVEHEEEEVDGKRVVVNFEEVMKYWQQKSEVIHVKGSAVNPKKVDSVIAELLEMGDL